MYKLFKLLPIIIPVIILVLSFIVSYLLDYRILLILLVLLWNRDILNTILSLLPIKAFSKV